ncbi:class I SAM-dependent rRNA methyltransferase [Portibacter lacus]|uniref:rRNA (Guanine-N2)-methyltransferase n=1 Tax=Portibacter lacus TaxID=1099794 RepID=A0AA37SMT1_9BACT|nr:class I SAM-dependent methyltransferase [Portibacter lacus]GLR17633.1 rRNA (guanine-N2)-methyltransferase [Portibacter lacus]
MSKIAFKVKKQAEKSILQGHPWVYENSIVKQNKEGKAGDIAVIFDQRRNQLLAIGLYDPQSVIRIRILHKGSPANINKEFFKTKFKSALDKRGPLLSTETTAFRLIYGENDGLAGLIIDIYNGIAVVKLYSEVWFPFLEMFQSILRELLDVSTVILRLNRILQQAKTPLKNGDVIGAALESEEVIFTEHGLKFKANLIKGHKTGYFLDHRHNRLKVRHLSKGKRVLDIFAYAGGFSVNALAGGATEVVSIDISEQALAIAKENAKLNFENPPHVTMAVDAFIGIKELRADDRRFDLVIVDPPSFAKSEAQIPGAIKSYDRLVREVLPLVAKGGILLMASCSSRIDKETFYDLVTTNVADNNRKYKILEKTAHDIDHPEGIKELSYLKSIYLQLD